MFNSITNIFKSRFTYGLLVSVVGVSLLGACATAPNSEDRRSGLKNDANTALNLATSSHTSFDSLIRGAPGYVVFPAVGKAAAGVGGAYGRGIVYKNGRQIGYADLRQASVGLQLGGQSYTEILVFESTQALDKFLLGNYEFGAQATAVALKSGEGTNAKFRNGVAVYTMDEAGLMFEAAVGGQKFSYQAFTS